MSATRSRTLALAVGLFAALWTGPDTLVAMLSPGGPEGVAGVVAPERHQLAALRERLVRRQAVEQKLEAQIGALAARLEELRAQREQSEAALDEARDRTAAVERRLDRLVPRLLARTQTVTERRVQASRALADLAGLSRQVELEPTLRARLLAISPLMLERLQTADASVAALRTERDQALARQSELQRKVPLLLAQGQRFERERMRARQHREALAERARAVRREITALKRDEVRLARRVMIVEDAHRASAEPEIGGPAPFQRPKAAPDGTLAAAVKGVAFQPGMLAVGVDAMPLHASRLVAAVGARDPQSSLTARVDVPTLPPPPAKPRATIAKADVEAAMPRARRTSLDQTAALDAGKLGLTMAALSSPRPADRVEQPQTPIMPLPGRVVSGYGESIDALDERGITIAAAAGQGVAAPEDGRVVFAGDFKSYGLLLIIEHDREYHTLLWGFSRLDVAPGERVRTGQVVGVMAADGDPAPQLHVELRRNGRPVNPMPWLAASSSKVRG